MFIVFYCICVITICSVHIIYENKRKPPNRITGQVMGPCLITGADHGRPQFGAVLGRKTMIQRSDKAIPEDPCMEYLPTSLTPKVI